MITIHPRDARDFTYCGQATLDADIINPVVAETLNGSFTFEFDYPSDAPAAELLAVENIVAAPVPGESQRQGFRISEIQATTDALLHVVCLHVFYDLASNLVADTFIVNKNPKQALSQLLGAAQFPTGFTSQGAASPIANIRVVRMSVAAAILDGGTDNTLMSRLGGDYTRDNFHILQQTRRGADRGVVIQDRKNLTGYKSTLDFTTVTTRILPVGFDGLLLPELYVDSPKLGQYQQPHVRVVRFEKVKATPEGQTPKEDELTLAQAHAELRRLAKLQYTEGKLDEPSASYSVSFADLASTREYADLQDLEQVLLGDTVTVIHAGLNARLVSRVVAYAYDPLTGSYLNITLGSSAAKFTSITNKVNALGEAAQAAGELADFALASASGKNTNYYGTKQPASPQIGDVWFKENGELTEIWIWAITDDGTPGWVSLASDLNYSQIQGELDAAMAEVQAAVQAAKGAEAAAAAATEALDAAKGDIDEAKQAAEDAAQTANSVQGTVAGITGAVEQAEKDSQAAKDAADAAFNKAVTASEDLNAYKVTVQGLQADTYAAITALENNVNLRVKSGEIIAQINISPETILIAARRIHLSGETTIDDAVIKTAMIADAAITNAKIANLDAAKITTGYLAAERIQAGSITSDKLTIGTGYITTAMIKDAAITNAKIGSLDAGKINTGTLSAARIAAGSITSDKLTISSGFILTAMIKDAAITNAKIANLDAAKITTGYLSAARIEAGSITAAKLASNAIQVGLAGWTSSIRITPTQISWYNGTSLEGTITSAGMNFYFGTRFVGMMGTSYKDGSTSVRGMVTQLSGQGDFILWSYRTGTTGTFTSMLCMDPKGLFYGQKGMHLTMSLYAHNHNFYTAGNRFVNLQDFTTGSAWPSWVGNGNKAAVSFSTTHLYLTTNGTYYQMTNVMARITALIQRVNSLIGYFNQGWVKSISGSGSNITWTYYSSANLTTIPTTL